MINRTAPIFFIFAFLAMLLSCATTAIDVIPITPHDQPISRLVIDTITLESVYSYSSNQQELRNTIISSGKNHGFVIENNLLDDTLIDSCTIDFFLREKSYVEGFKTILSTAILAVVYDPDGNILYRISFLHDGKESLTSLRYVRDALNDIFNSLDKEIRATEKKL